MSFCNWSITYSDVHHQFGEVEVTSWSIGGREFRTDDTSRPRVDGRYFGQDFVDPGDVEISLIIRAEGKSRQERYENAMSLREEFTAVWNADSIRKTPGELAELEIGGRFVVEGRPRHVDWDDSLATFGIIRGSALFVRSFDVGYAAAEEGGSAWQEITVGLVPAQIGGLIAPLIEPLTTAENSTRARPFEVSGDGDVWPIIEVQGPIQSGAWVELTHEWAVQLNRGLAYDEVVTIDTRPGKRSMDINGRHTNVITHAGNTISQLSIPPGIHEVSLRGQSLEGTAKVTLRWRDVRTVM